MGFVTEYQCNSCGAYFGADDLHEKAGKLVCEACGYMDTWAQDAGDECACGDYPARTYEHEPRLKGILEHAFSEKLAVTDELVGELLPFFSKGYDEAFDAMADECEAQWERDNEHKERPQ